jgi:hypothetical protein
MIIASGLAVNGVFHPLTPSTSCHGIEPMDSGRKADVVVVGNVGIDTNVYLARPPDLSQEDHFTENVDYLGQPGGYTSRGFLPRPSSVTSVPTHSGPGSGPSWPPTALS